MELLYSLSCTWDFEVDWAGLVLALGLAWFCKSKWKIAFDFSLPRTGLQYGLHTMVQSSTPAVHLAVRAG